MNLDDISPGLSEQPTDIQIRTVMHSLNSDVRILRMSAPTDWRRHIADRIERIQERLEILYGLIEKKKAGV